MDSKRNLMRLRQEVCGPTLVQRDEPEIEWRDYLRIQPGSYFAYCRWAKKYRDRGFRRWTCLLRFNVLSDDLLRSLGSVPCWLNLSGGEKPFAGRRSRYFAEWIRANGTAPTRGDRLSPRVFVGRIELITPEIKRSMENAIARADWPAIERYGRFLDPILKRIVAENPATANQIAQVREKIQVSINAGGCR